MISMPKIENKVCPDIHFSEISRLRPVRIPFKYHLSQKYWSEGGLLAMLHINLSMVTLPLKGKQTFYPMKEKSQVKTKHPISEQKVPLYMVFWEILGLRRVITPFDHRLSQNIGEGGGFE